MPDPVRQSSIEAIACWLAAASSAEEARPFQVQRPEVIHTHGSAALQIDRIDPLRQPALCESARQPAAASSASEARRLRMQKSSDPRATDPIRSASHPAASQRAPHGGLL